ncbi:hypothetical protein SASPL_121858 [Salvia splendens]|uniref:Rubisco LSMT substrate-binding domain-containing protein n=1 Tax=Salvia splendens TaxID=180675 RepID=A0A8X8ZWZ1_SALSN|nr:hypothetical protein SASPL_121858 [Salvia splendens]
MAGASRILQTTLLPTFSKNPSLHTTRSHSHGCCVPPTAKRGAFFDRIRCSVAAAAAGENISMAGVPWGCDVDSVDNAAALQAWLSESGLPPHKMGIQKVEVGERGLVALKNVRKGEKLLFVPPSLLITADSTWLYSWSCREAGEVLKQYNVPDWPLLATYLISEACLMNSSRWSNYIAALPRQPYSLFYWTRPELDRYLEASQIRQRSIERINDVTGTYGFLHQMSFQYIDLRDRIFSKHPDLFPAEVFNMESYRSSFGILFSRLVCLPSMDGRVALVPWADMLNHSCEIEHISQVSRSSYHMVRNPTGAVSFIWIRAPGRGTNPSDSVELSLSISKSDKCYKEKVAALKKQGLSATQCFPLQITGWPLELMAYAYLAVSPPSMISQFDEMAAAASNKTTSKKDIRYGEIEEDALQFILDACEASISKYSKFLQVNEWINGFGRDKPKSVFLKQLAVDLCTSQRRMLFRAQYILRRRLRDIRSGELKALRLFDGLRKLFK